MITVVLLQNTLIKSKVYAAGEYVELEDDVAQKFCDNALAHPLYAEDLEKVGMSIDEEAVVEVAEVKPVVVTTKKKATKKGKK